jgi:hypothetical protein
MSEGWNEATLGDLLAMLPRPPAAWIEAAAAIPALEVAIEHLRVLGPMDVELRADEVDRLETALRQAGVEPTVELREALRRRIDSPR